MDIEMTIGGIALLPIIVALVEVAKTIGMKTSWAPWLTGILSVIGYVLVLFTQSYPEYTSYVVSALTILTIFLGSTGLYTVAKNTASALRGK